MLIEAAMGAEMRPYSVDKTYICTKWQEKSPHSRCPLWVISGPVRCKTACPL